MAGLVSKFEQMNGKLLRAVNYQDNPTIKTYYLLYAVIKSLGYRINYLEFASIVQQKTSFMINRKPAGEMKKIYQIIST